jgi:hypothetical protein
VTSPLDQQILRRQVFVPSSRADYCRLARHPLIIDGEREWSFPQTDHWDRVCERALFIN